MKLWINEGLLVTFSFISFIYQILIFPAIFKLLYNPRNLNLNSCSESPWES